MSPSASEQHPVRPSRHIRPQAYASLGDADSAVSAWTELRAGGVRPDPQAWAALFGACRDGGQPDLALVLFQAMRGAGLRPVRHHYNILIDAAAKAHQPERALGLVREMREAGFDPDEYTFNSVLRVRAGGRACVRACACVRREKKRWMQRAPAPRFCRLNRRLVPASCGLRARRHPTQRHLSMPLPCCFLSAPPPLSRCPLQARVATDGVQSGFTVIREMENAGIRAGAVTWTHLIDAAAEGSDAPGALAAFQAMRRSGLRPDVVSWTAVIKAHAAQLDVAGATELYRSMCAEAAGAGLPPGAPRGPAPNLSTYLTLLKAAVAAGEAAVAEEVYGDMRNAG